MDKLPHIFFFTVHTAVHWIVHPMAHHKEKAHFLLVNCPAHPGLQKLLQPCSRAARKWRENEEMKRKWRENEEIERKWRENEEMERERENGERIRKWRGDREKMRKWRENEERNRE